MTELVGGGPRPLEAQDFDDAMLSLEIEDKLVAPDGDASACTKKSMSDELARTT